MDKFLFAQELDLCQVIPETTHYLQILNYSSVFEPPKLAKGVSLASGTRLVVHQLANDPNTFSPRVISIPKDKYRGLVREWHLPARAVETSAVVGPFFWYDFEEHDDDKHMHIIFRKSDVKWGANSRGWEMTLSYSFKTGITSGYVKGTKSADIENLVYQVQQCASSVGHPLLLPVLILCRELSLDNDEAQRNSRQKVRELEEMLLNRYRDSPGTRNVHDKELALENIISQLHDHQCKVLWKRPQTWQKVVSRMMRANRAFWDGLAAVQQQDLVIEKVHQTMLSRLNFLDVKLAGLESHAQVTLERMNLLRELERLLAGAIRRDSISMKTLAFLGATFLPGTFLSSIFSMSFFDFKQGTVSSQLWIYFVIMVPLTGMVLGGWWKYNQVSFKRVERDRADTEAQVDYVEDFVRQKIRRRTTNLTAPGIGTT
ncbi:hypothetical protein UCREL1_5631 [Eutypa lata UCREL1]|uniref:Uncharacterized protein n=1 Tax=Eutypa lata (strain UCR-EL1) TaxID=1287681 RepID=M7TBU8_EUTLA|nr:hypothetical protein UCREL1_5631 [Eutypa lata UCREL1]